jgi:DNA-binding SARP family transcriptional activator
MFMASYRLQSVLGRRGSQTETTGGGGRGEASLELIGSGNWGAPSGSSGLGSKFADLPAGPLFDAFPYGLVLARPDGDIVKLNRRARSTLLADGGAPLERWNCCELICDQAGPLLGTGCLSQLARATTADLPEVRIDVDGERLRTSAWVTVSTLERDDLVLFHLRPGRPGDRRRRTRQGWHGDSSGGSRAELRVVTLGSFSLERAEGLIHEDWVTRRPGQLLKFLVARRRRLSSPDQISEALWPEAGHEDGKNRLRYQVHTLRGKLDPTRGRHTESRFIRSRQGGYLFDTSVTWIDADEFEREARAGLAAMRKEDPAAARPHLARASALYKGPFLPDDPYAEWALEERERLRELAVVVLRSRAEALDALDDLDAAIESAKRLAEVEPFDNDVQRLLLALLLKRGRRGEAMRRFDFFCRRLESGFGGRPDFELRSLEPSATADAS